MTDSNQNLVEMVDATFVPQMVRYHEGRFVIFCLKELTQQLYKMLIHDQTEQEMKWRDTAAGWLGGWGRWS